MKLFISYSHQDKVTAGDIAAVCGAQGIDFFLDEKDITWGDSITDAVKRGLAECSHLVVVVSPATVRSWWVPFELGRAVERGLRVLPYLTHPSIELPRFLSDTLWVCGLEQLELALTTLFGTAAPANSGEETSAALRDAAFRAYAQVFFSGDDDKKRLVSSQVIEAHTGIAPPASVVDIHRQMCVRDRKLYTGSEFMDRAAEILKGAYIDDAQKAEFLDWLTRVASGV